MFLDERKRQARALGDPDDRHAPQYPAFVAPLVLLGSPAFDQALLLVEVDRRHRHAAALRHFAHGQRPAIFRHPLFLNHGSGFPRAYSR
ncbi:hypothetical protein ADT71_07250 [Novosphingobium sp. ST904]|nr:hypothetical protein ADT71_07250 [Novosphingobium sp. ST904]